MNIRNTTTAVISSLKFKNFFAKKRRMPLVYIWYAELIIGILLLFVVLGFNWRTYRSLVAAQPEPPQEEIQKIIVLDKPTVKQAADTIAQHAAFLDHPIFPTLIQNPF